MRTWKAQENYATKMNKQGCVKISAWVPEHLRQELLDIAEEMRRENLADRHKQRANKESD